MKEYHFFSPGRVNVIGEHMDYNGGCVMPAAIEQGITAKVKYTENNEIKLSSAQFEVSATFNLDETKDNAVTSGVWTDYPLGVIHLLQKQGTKVSACEIELSSTLPDGSGLSSSAALEVLVAYILQYPNNKNIDLVALAHFCQKVENEFVGVNCGIMDQFAVANGKKGNAMFLNCAGLVNEYVPFELGEYSLVIINSKQPRTLAGSAFNERREQCDLALAAIQEHKDLKHLAHAQLSDLAFIKNETVKKRAKHVITEQQRVLKSVEALKKGDLHRLGDLLNASHTSLNNDYEVSSDALNLIIASSIDFEDCLGARLTGAGFGGCCIALVKTNSIEAYQKSVANKYFETLNIQPEFYITQAQDGVRLM